MKHLTTMMLLALVSAATFTGCSILGDPVAERVAKAVDKYCEEPFGARQLYRTTVNEELAMEGHAIEVQCFGDPEPVPQTRLEMLQELHRHAVAMRQTITLEPET